MNAWRVPIPLDVKRFRFVIDGGIADPAHPKRTAQNLRRCEGQANGVIDVRNAVAELYERQSPLLRSLALGNVAVENGQPVARGIGLHVEPAIAPVRPSVTVFQIERRPGRHGVFEVVA